MFLPCDDSRRSCCFPSINLGRSADTVQAGEHVVRIISKKLIAYVLSICGGRNYRWCVRIWSSRNNDVRNWWSTRLILIQREFVIFISEWVCIPEQFPEPLRCIRPPRGWGKANHWPNAVVIRHGVSDTLWEVAFYFNKQRAARKSEAGTVTARNEDSCLKFFVVATEKSFGHIDLYSNIL